MGEVSPDLDLPAVLTGETRLQAFRLACLIGRTLALQKSKSKSKYAKASPQLQVRYMAKGIEVLRGYPESFDALSVEGNGPLPKQLMHLRYATGSVPECGRLFNRLLTDWEPCRHGLKRLKRERERADCLTVREAAKELRIENLAVRQLVDRGLIEPLDSRGSERRYDWLRREDVDRIAEALASRLSVREFSRDHNVPLYATLQLISSGLLALSDCPFVTELYGRPQLIRADADAFIARLRSVVHFPAYDSETVSLEDAFHGVGDQPKPWSAMIKAAFERRLELYWNGDPHETLSVKDLHISKRLACDLAAKRRPELLEVPASYEDCLVQANLSRGEAEQYLNCFPRDLAWLLCNGRMSAEFPSNQIAQLGHELISSREISWRWRVSPALRDALPTKHGIARCAGPFWPRAEIEAFFARRFPSGGPVE